MFTTLGNFSFNQGKVFCGSANGAQRSAFRGEKTNLPDTQEVAPDDLRESSSFSCVTRGCLVVFHEGDKQAIRGVGRRELKAVGQTGNRSVHRIAGSSFQRSFVSSCPSCSPLPETGRPR